MINKLNYRYFLYPTILIVSTLILLLTGIYDKQITESIGTAQTNFFTVLFRELPIISYFIVFWAILFLFLNNITPLKNWEDKKKKNHILTLFYIALIITFSCYLAYKKFFIKSSADEICVAAFILILFILFGILFPIYWIKINKYNVPDVSLDKFAKAVIFILVCLLITMFDKWLYGRNRPFQYYNHSDRIFTHIFQINSSGLKGNSFNSGHTMSVALIISLAFLTDKRKYKYYILGTGLTITLITAITRVLIFAHWSSDVGFSIVLAILIYPVVGDITDLYLRIHRNKKIRNKSKNNELNEEKIDV